MAEAGFSQDQFRCPLCLDLLKDLVTIPCEHSYCMSCITDHWNQEDQKRVYSCPQCRKTFRPRPALNKSTMLAEVLEKPKMIIQTTAPAELHENLLKVNRHNLMNATGRPQKMMCHQHGKPLEIYCRTDQQCICVFCVVEKHINHDTVSTAAGRTEKQVQTQKHWHAKYFKILNLIKILTTLKLILNSLQLYEFYKWKWLRNKLEQTNIKRKKSAIYSNN